MSIIQQSTNVHTKLLENVIDAIFLRIEQEIDKDSNYQLRDIDYLELNSVYGGVFGRALELLCFSTIKLYKSSYDHKGIVEIFCANGKSYKLYVGVNYCSCPSYKYEVIKRRSQITCKHNLAARIAIVLQKFQLVETTAEKFKQILLQLHEQTNTKDI